jgi:hypothetical protein
MSIAHVISALVAEDGLLLMAVNWLTSLPKYLGQNTEPFIMKPPKQDALNILLSRMANGTQPM